MIDLSADFRLDSLISYKKWYGGNFKSNKFFKKAIYSITEFKRNKLPNFNIISCPGCYPTSVQIPLIPLVENKMINLKNIIVDSKSGYSGAGKNIKKEILLIKIYFNSVSAYGVGSHRHMGEIDQELTKISKNKVKVFFTPHLLPMFRGILSTIYIEAKKNYNALSIYNFLKKYHKNNYFIKFAKFNSAIGTGSVMDTNFCEISVCKNRENNKVIIISAIDNLLKGGSGQAVQNMNVSFELKETLGLI